MFLKLALSLVYPLRSFLLKFLIVFYHYCIFPFLNVFSIFGYCFAEVQHFILVQFYSYWTLYSSVSLHQHSQQQQQQQQQHKHKHSQSQDEKDDAAPQEDSSPDDIKRSDVNPESQEYLASGDSLVPSVSFAGGALLWPYYLGLGHSIYKHFNIDKMKFLSSSAGAFAAVPLAIGKDPYSWCREDWVKCLLHFVSRRFGCFFDSSAFYYELWDSYLPPDAHIRCTNRLYLSITLFPSFKNMVISKFDSREQLIQSIIASTCVPLIFLRDIPYIPGIGRAIDGGLTNDQPILNPSTITCSIFNTNADIQPIHIRYKLWQTVIIPNLEQVWIMARNAELDIHHEKYRHLWRQPCFRAVRRRSSIETPKMTPIIEKRVKQRQELLKMALLPSPTSSTISSTTVSNTAIKGHVTTTTTLSSLPTLASAQSEKSQSRSADMKRRMKNSDEYEHDNDDNGNSIENGKHADSTTLPIFPRLPLDETSGMLEESMILQPEEGVQSRAMHDQRNKDPNHTSAARHDNNLEHTHDDDESPVDLKLPEYLQQNVSQPSFFHFVNSSALDFDANSIDMTTIPLHLTHNSAQEERKLRDAIERYQRYQLDLLKQHELRQNSLFQDSDTQSNGTKNDLKHNNGKTISQFDNCDCQISPDKAE